MQEEKYLTGGDLRRFDRLKFIGLENQKKHLKSLVLITPANEPNTELAKNLILAGLGVAIYDTAIITQEDFEKNPLIAHSQIGLKRGKIVFERLKRMNPYSKSQYFDDQINIQKGMAGKSSLFSNFSMVCTSFSNCEIIQNWGELTKKEGKPYFNIVCAGQKCLPVQLKKMFPTKKPTTKPGGPLSMRNPTIKRSLSHEIPCHGDKSNFSLLKSVLMMRDEETSKQLLMSFGKLYGIDFCPIYSVIGSLISKQITEMVHSKDFSHSQSKSSRSSLNWLICDPEDGEESMSTIEKQLRASDRPISMSW